MFKVQKTPWNSGLVVWKKVIVRESSVLKMWSCLVFLCRSKMTDLPMTRGMLQHSYWEQEHCHSFLLCGFEVLWQVWVPGGEISKDLFLLYLVWSRVLLGFFVTDWNFKSRHEECYGYVSNCSPAASAVPWYHTCVADCIWAALLRNESIPALLKPAGTIFEQMGLNALMSCKQLFVFHREENGHVSIESDIIERCHTKDVKPQCNFWKRSWSMSNSNWLVSEFSLEKMHNDGTLWKSWPTINLMNIFVSSIGDLWNGWKRVGSL